jgi:hypothetical protein
MGLEAATFIHELDPSNPVGGSDPKAQGDDHIRLTKQTLQNTLPNVEGAVTASHTELNVLDGITATTAELNKMDGFTGSPTDLNEILTRLGGLKVAFCRGTGAAGIDTGYANKNVNSVTNPSAGAFVINYAAAGFSAPPMVIAICQNNSPSGFNITVFSVDANETALNMRNMSSILSSHIFLFLAVGT